ncbi:MAG: NAD(P)/FAD-dependent oxidoreductase [Actinobacteria bacterium]|nr:MAG: NAD(P)/FAD-dependent oxidoreductase [Actinomycetota bacterium]
MRVVIAGSGFGGLFAARHLQRLLPRSVPAEITLLNEENFFLFTPMLTEVVSGEVEAQHIVTPIRSFLRDPRLRFHQASVTHVDFENKVVTAICEKAHCLVLEYDYLVLAVGTKTIVPSVPAEEPWLFPLQNLTDAMRLHNQVLDMFEHADMLDRRDVDRRRMLTFVVAGGGFAGVETATAIESIVFGTLLPQYPSIGPGDVRLVLAHGGSRILPELGDELAAYAERLMSDRNIELRLGSSVSLPEEHLARIDDENIPCATVVWTAGARAAELAGELSVPKNSKGRIVVDERGLVQGHDNVFALGDCAAHPDPKGRPYPPTAQIAIRQARAVAGNILASGSRAPLHVFAYEMQGMVVPLGRRSAAAVLKGLRFRGLFAWWLSRSLYILRVPSWSNRIRIVLDWTLDLVFPRPTNRIAIR